MSSRSSASQAFVDNVGFRPSFRLAAMLFLCAVFALAAFAPIGLSVVAVFLFAGPHNWIEARYFLSRLPARWGKLRVFFVSSMVGVVGLAGANAGLLWSSRWSGANLPNVATWMAVWNTALLLWIGLLIELRCRQPPRRDWPLVRPALLALTAIAWLLPFHFAIALVYLHPLVGLWILDREIVRSRPAWRDAYRQCLLLLPILLGVIWMTSHGTSLTITDPVAKRIVEHSGAGLLPFSSRGLVSTHAFLELMHYGVWLLAIPLATRSFAVRSMPLARRSVSWRAGVMGVLACGVVFVLVLWIGFLADYATTRDVYFTVAMLHVLAECPFLLRAL